MNENFSIAELNIQEIAEITSCKEANELIEKGWYYLNCHTRTDIEATIHVLGLPLASTMKRTNKIFDLSD